MTLDAAPEMRSPPPERRQTSRPSYDASGGLRSPFVSLALLYTLGLFLFYQQGLIDGTLLRDAILMEIALAALFCVAFKSGLNRRFRDPSLIPAQLLTILLIMLAIASVERATQIALVPFTLMAFWFSIFRISPTSLLLLGAGFLCIHLGLILARGFGERFTTPFEVDLMQWWMLALTLPGAVLAGRQIRQLQDQLAATQYELEHYEEKSIRDDLTGLYNRRRLLEELELARAQAEAKSLPFSVCLIDVDHFKEINDTNGHQAGDNILCQFAYVGRDCIRDSDVFGRWGGDEFLLILPRTDLRGAVMHAERLRVYAHFLDFEKVLEQKHISLSIGVAQYRRGERISDLVARADLALYQAKQLGRNRVEWMRE